jgi:hypothetical protein
MMYVIEFQKRGLPHAHIVLKTNTEPTTPGEIDAVLSAELPREEGELRNRVEKYMMHECRSYR